MSVLVCVQNGTGSAQAAWVIGKETVIVGNTPEIFVSCHYTPSTCLFQIGNAIQFCKTRVAAPIIGTGALFDIDVAVGAVIVSTLCLSVSAMRFLSEAQHLREVDVYELWKFLDKIEVTPTWSVLELHIWFSGDVRKYGGIAEERAPIAKSSIFGTHNSTLDFPARSQKVATTSQTIRK